MEIVKKHAHILILLALAVGITIFVTVRVIPTRAEVTPRLDPESGADTCPAGFGLEDFESGTDGYREGGGPIISTLPGVEFATTDGQDWMTGDWASGYNGKYPNGAYTSGGQKWAWLGTSQGSGIIDFTDGTASYVSVYTSTYSGLILEAYADDGTFLETSDWADTNIRTGTMTHLSISRTTADIGYVIVHDTGNFWLIDWLCVSKEASAVQDVVINLEADVKPGGSPNIINRTSRGNVLVALLGSENFDVATVLSDTVLFDDASAKKREQPRDVNNDGIEDLVFYFDVQLLNLQNIEPISLPDDTHEACITGSTSDGTRFKGCDSVKLLK